MTIGKTPRSLRANVVGASLGSSFRVGIDPSSLVTTAAAVLMTAGSVGNAEAQQSEPLPSVTVDAPVVHHRSAPPRQSVAHTRARVALRRAAPRTPPAPAQPTSSPAGATSVPTFARLPGSNPYADAAAPYKADRLASSKFAEPLLNTPKTVTVLTKEIIEDKNATSFRDLARTTAGLTLGTGEGGNAFGDRFFIRGFDARNDVFVDGVRDPAVSIRENFFTEQVEILRGPSSSFAGRGTAGGAVNIVTKQAQDQNFYKADATVGTDSTRRLTFDVNQVISPALSIRAAGMGQQANVAGRDFVFDDRWGGLLAVAFKPNDQLKVTANYMHIDLNMLPDFGVPYNTAAGAPFTETGVPRNTYYGFVNRDFQKVKQDILTQNTEYAVNEHLTVSNKFRYERSVLNYLGTIPESPNLTTLTYTGNPQSRYQVTTVLADQTDATFKFDVGPVKSTTSVGTEFSREQVSYDTYKGLSSEALPGGFSGSGSVMNASIFNPPNLLPFSGSPVLTGNPIATRVDTKSVYLIQNVNYQDLVILNGGLRYDNYNIRSSQAGSTVGTTSGLVNYNAGITIKPLPYASVYAAYATSSNPVGSALDGSSLAYGGFNPIAPVNQVFAPQRNKAFEIGTKWELFDRHLLLTAALFHTRVDNALESITLNGVRNTIVQGASYHVQGIDLGLGGKITPEWSVFGGMTLMESRVDQSAVPSNVGLKLANVAHQSFNLLSKYQVTNWLEIGGQATYMSRIYGGTLLAANQGTSIPSHWRFDTFLEGKINDKLTLKLFVNNIFNTRYYDALYQSAAPFVFIAPGRSAQIMLSAKF
ncbi:MULTISPECIES: TonB-dependent receptor [unclassified Beijerinckia]|uniref:TonB-dependent receptor n=1 Tax=unclassified Beijerinckia TaxID=2638183 RepID=UPI0008963DE7|nr:MULTISPECIES: TonB-dependent receptor [unclassified Beijerinckia]MDH7799820.1 catecholate siderophore receptor [Beijerinckia sp. GAS462]SED38669.1 catecholate siderophore receptor [Beijerinckia sp. 28-YEA-48]